MKSKKKFLVPFSLDGAIEVEAENESEAIFAVNSATDEELIAGISRSQFDCIDCDAIIIEPKHITRVME